MQNNNFTHEEICNFNFFNSGTAFFDNFYDAEYSENIKLNKKAATSKFDILKFSKNRKIALFKDKNKVYYTSLQGCNCNQYENSENGCCVHMFKLAQILGIIDIETGILLYPQTDFEEIPFEEVVCDEIPQETSSRKYEPPSTVGIGKHCKHCNKVINYNEKICPYCKCDADTKASDNNFPSGCLISVIILIFLLVLIIVIT